MSVSDASSRRSSGPVPLVSAGSASAARSALWLSTTVVLALITLYFVGIDQGATSVLGPDNTVIHEFVHDARHLLGFPCH